MRNETLASTKEDVKIKEVAFLIRKSILDCKHQPLPENITLEDVRKGEVETPEILEKFLTYLIAGPDSRMHESDVKQRRIKSISDDVIYATTGRKKKPSKHLMLGMAIKSLTGSKTVLQILNRYGYCSSYNTIQEIETELTFEANKRQEILPYGMELGINDTGIAWDNYDCFVETKDGKDTLHDTVGISYQTLQKQVEPENNENNSIENEIDLEIQRFHDKKDLGKKRRRAYSSRMLDIEPYRKKPKMDASKLLPPSAKRYAFQPPSLAAAQKKDFLRVFSSKFDETNSIPMWVGCNSRNDASSFDQKQKIFYLPPIKQSPTSHSVVLETMKRPQQLAKESKIKEIAVTYDLAIAKVAMQIQAKESPRFHNLFIAMGTFHLEMAFFNALGKYIEESGGPYILVESGVIASNSVKNFLNLNSYNRRKRLHGLLSLTREILHYDSFLENIGSESHMSRQRQNSDLELIESKKWVEEFENYMKYKKETEEGMHGKTAQYWIGYVILMNLYRLLVHSVREGDLLLYTFCLSQISDLFFTFNQPNYARWTVRYHDNLLKLKESHPEVYKSFSKGFFGIKRTNKKFSRLPVDLTLEQTTNADAASQKVGITNLTNSISARQKWADSHYMRTEIISNLKDDLNLSSKDDLSKELK